jgi:hypothetical protein
MPEFTRNIGKTGSELINAATGVTFSKELKSRFERFRRAHLAWVAANNKVESAAEVETAKRLNQAEADAEQDELVDLLATMLVTDGFSRTSPFKNLSAFAPTQMKKLGDVKEAKACLQLARNVSKSKTASAKTKTVAAKLVTAANKVIALAKPIADAQEGTSGRRQNRDALVGEWGKSYRLLKQAALLEREEEGTTTFDALFPAQSRPAKKRATKAPATNGASDGSESSDDE